MKTPEKIVKALRHCAQEGVTCELCPYYVPSPSPEDYEKLPDDWFWGRDCDQALLDAADLIEKLLAQKGEE